MESDFMATHYYSRDGDVDMDDFSSGGVGMIDRSLLDRWPSSTRSGDTIHHDHQTLTQNRSTSRSFEGSQSKNRTPW